MCDGMSHMLKPVFSEIQQYIIVLNIPGVLVPILNVLYFMLIVAVVLLLVQNF